MHSSAASGSQNPAPDPVEARKAEHLQVTASRDVNTVTGPGWADIRLIHEALPEVDQDAIDLGVEFLDRRDAFRARMVEQVCHIENYRKTVYHTEGRVLAGKEAALEWIGKYAAHFPDPSVEDSS